MVLQAVVDPLQRQRLAGQVGGAGVLAASALGAGEDVQPVLPRQVARGVHAHAQLARVGVVGHHLLQVHRGHHVGGPAAAEEEGGQRGDDVEMLARGQQHQEAEDGGQLHPVTELVAGLQRALGPAGEGGGQRAAGDGKVAFVGDACVGGREQCEAEAVVEQVGDHDHRDQHQHQQCLAVLLQPLRAQHVTAPEGIGQRRQHGQLDGVLERRKQTAGQARVDEGLVVTDGDELHLAYQQGHEAEEDDCMHQPRLPVARNHALLHEAVDEHGLQSRRRVVPTHLGLQAQHDRHLAPRQPGKAGKAGQHQQRDSQWAHGTGAGRIGPGSQPRPGCSAACPCPGG